MYVSMRDFKSHLSRYVSQAQAGQVIELTSHRKVVARIIGVTNANTNSTGATQLVAAGAATWQGGRPVGAVFELTGHGKPVSALVLEDRG
jgi:prevent-host-death family protein